MLLTALVSPIIDKVLPRFFADKDKRLEAKTEIEKQLQANEHDITATLLGAQRDIIVAEAKGESWLQQSWRPICMLIFTALIVAQWLGYAAPGLPEQATEGLFDLVRIGLGGYVIGRSGEKIAKQLYPTGRKQ